MVNIHHFCQSSRSHIHAAGVVSAQFSRLCHVEICVCSLLEETINLKGRGGTRVTHIVMRLDTLRLKTDGPAYADMLASIQEAALTLPNLRTFTVETFDEVESIDLVEKLAFLHSNGMLRRRTCKEAQKIAKEAQENPTRYSEDQGVISPFWFSSEFSDYARDEWYAIILFHQFIDIFG